MNSTSLARRSLGFLARLALPLALLAANCAQAQTVTLADKPLFSTTTVPGNLLLDLSVEYPTANSSAYFSTTAYSSSTLYLGYFDGAKCYQYVYNATTPASSYFQPNSAASSHTCSSTTTLPLWSGNWLNYASMQGLDIFRWVLTGGNRTVDQTTAQGGKTILQRSTHSGQGGSGDAPNKALTASDEPGATPFNWGTQNNTRVYGAGIQMWITGNNTSLDSPTTADYKAQSCTSTCDSNKTSDADSDGNKLKTVVYALYMNVRVCDSSVSVESNCVLYGSTYKPEGLMQQYSQSLRYGAVAYLNDSNALRDGGVLRARMAYIGPQVPVPGSASTTNANPEWSSTTGVMVTSPDAQDVTDSNTYTGVTVAQSGVMNYLNKFGYTSNSYKTYDPVSELYYASLRYLKGQSNVSTYSDVSGAPDSGTKATWVDGFPVITSWATVGTTYVQANDPILYSCQKNFILGIGDVNTHRDGNLPGSTLTDQEPAVPTEVAADTTVNVATATDALGNMEGTSTNLGEQYAAGDYATYYIAGLAYDAHLPLTGKGVRTFTDSSTSPATVTISTVSTYWLDVLEYQTYVTNNQYYYATKYGGFTVPSGYTYGTALADNSWYTSTNTIGGNKQPDNYFTAANATLMQAGLTSAFAKIIAEKEKANGTSLAVPTPNVTATGAMSYSATYDPTTWTGEVIGSSIAFDPVTDAPTLTQQWDARDLLSASTVTASTRKIVTCCTTSTTAPGVAFTTALTSSSTLISRTYVASFSAVPGVTGTQSAANYIAYLRGDTSKEIANGGIYRTRAYRLGDIVNSKPTAVGTPAYQFFDTTNAGYAAFKAQWANRKTVVYVGANDGMLHAFDGTKGAATSGSELFAYIPSFVYGTSSTAATTGLASLGNPSFVHHYMVDSTPGQFDIDLNKTYGSTTAAPNWHTLLIGGLGKGGQGYYAIDVTDPTSWTDEATVATKVMWEFTDSRLGYSYGTPSVVKTAKYGWVVVFTSGYNNSDGLGYIFFVNPATGALLEAVSTGTNSNSAGALNLGQQSAYVQDYTDMTADAIYAGDLQGNVWRVNVTGTPTSYPTATKIAAFGSTQPISTRPLIEIASNTNTRYVLVGTGKLLADSDISTSATQSFYAIADGILTSGAFYGSASQPLPTGISFPITRSVLNANTSLLTGIGSSPTYVMGWYFDLPVTTGTNPIAQRVNVDPFANQGIVAFIGNLPNGSACSPSGTGSLYAVNFGTGQTVLLTADLSAATASQTISGGVGTDVAIISVDGNLNIYTGGSKGVVAKAPASLTTAAGVTQINWRDVPATN